MMDVENIRLTIQYPSYVNSLSDITLLLQKDFYFKKHVLSYAAFQFVYVFVVFVCSFLVSLLLSLHSGNLGECA